jgi:hypothetical protein
MAYSGMITSWSRRSFLKNTAIASGVFSKAALISRMSLSRQPEISRHEVLTSFRISPAHWLKDERLEILFDFFNTQRGIVDELVFFTSATHPPLPLDEIERRAARLTKVLPRVREQGMRAGINVLSTMGHHEENLPNSLQMPWQHVRDPEGRECLGSFCPAHPELLDYARKVYTLMAQCGPDFVWIDDDVRLQGHGAVKFACFCDLCIERFSREVSREFRRETLVAAFDSGSLEERLQLRRQWLEHNRKTIDNLLRNIEEAAHDVKPRLELGLMTGDRFYEGYDFGSWARTLAGPAKSPVRWRPGGGFYSDEALLGLVEKAHAMGRQISVLPADVKIIQSEIENFPYQRLRKSDHTTVVEAAADMAAGTTGIAFNVLTMQKDPLDEYDSLFRKMSEYSPFYKELKSELERSLALGIWPAWNQDLFSTINVDGQWLAGDKMSLNEPYVLGEIGIPICYDPRGATATALAGSSVFAFRRDRLRQMFGSAVLMDVSAWQALKQLGLDRWTGIRGAEPVDHDATEVLTEHPLNERFAGWSRDCRQSFWPERGWSLTPSDTGTEVLARMVDYGGRDLGPCMTAFTNGLGGRVVIMGYFPWSQVHSLAKSSQLKSVCAWLSRGNLPVVSESFSKVIVWCRQGEHGGNCLVILNASLDRVDRLTLRVQSNDRHFIHFSADDSPQQLTAELLESSSGQVRLVVPGFNPWTIHMLVNRTA